MASISGSVFSQTLQDITATKLDELSKRRAAFEDEKATILAALHAEKDRIQRLVVLADGVKSCYTGKENKPQQLETELHNLDLFLAQARYDPSISDKLLQTWESSLLEHLDTMSLKYSYAALYAQLVTEWLSLDKPDAAVVSVGDGAMAEPFEDLGSAERLRAREQWEKDVFEEAQVDEKALQHYLEELFINEPHDRKEKATALQDLKGSTKVFEEELALPVQFNHGSLDWTIKGLLASDLLTDQKREVLKDFQSNPTILSEVADVLNMRMAALDTWSWGPSVPVEEHRKINGVFDVKMHEDLLQAIFIQYIGVKWSVFFKQAFHRYRRSGGPWITPEVPTADKQRLQYYASDLTTQGSVQELRRNTFWKEYFVAQLLDHAHQAVDHLDGEEEAQPVPQLKAKRHARGYLARAAPAPAGATVQMESYTGFDRETDLHTIQPEYEDTTKTLNPMERKQKLLHILATEAAINTRTHGEFTALHAGFARWNDLLPHTTVRSIMSLFGVSKKWLDFFVRFLETPLQFLGDDPSIPPRTRRRGAPASHVLSDVFGEVTLFCLDFAVNRATNGSTLYRLFDDVWFWNCSHEATITAWAAVESFARATSTEVEERKTGCVRISGRKDLSLPVSESLPSGPISWGFLQLSPQTGCFEIQQSMITSHITDLQRQLQDKRQSIFAFIQTWNTYADTFFTSNFGSPANCFGRAHVDAMLAAHARIQREVFRGLGLLDGDVHANSVADYLKATLNKRYGVADLPDAYLFFPVELGGLGLRSPFVPILQLREEVTPDPAALIEDFFEKEKESYAAAQREFQDRQTHFNLLPGRAPTGDPVPYLPFAEYARAREAFRSVSRKGLADVYEKLLLRPSGDLPSVHRDTIIRTSGGRAAFREDVGRAVMPDALAALARQLGGEEKLRKVLGEPLKPYWAWILALYGPEALRRVGGLALVDRGLLPMGMVGLFREKRVKWQE